MLQETSRLRNRSTVLSDTLSSVEIELRSCRDALERALVDRDELQRQAACHCAEIDRLRQVNYHPHAPSTPFPQLCSIYY